MAYEHRIREEKRGQHVPGRNDDRKSDRSGNVGDKDVTRRDETEWKRASGQLIRKR